MKSAICLLFYIVIIQAQEKSFKFKKPHRFTKRDDDDDDDGDGDGDGDGDDDENNPLLVKAFLPNTLPVSTQDSMSNEGDFIRSFANTVILFID